jgi:hypothetical protein
LSDAPFPHVIETIFVAFPDALMFLRLWLRPTATVAAAAKIDQLVAYGSNAEERRTTPNPANPKIKPPGVTQRGCAFK